MVSFREIEQNEFNLNLPRYIDSQTPEDIQDIAAHLQGGIPAADVDALQRYWTVCPQLRHTLFAENRLGYLDLTVDKAAIKSTIFEHPEFAAFTAGMAAHFDVWRQTSTAWLKSLEPGHHPKEVIARLSESLLAHYAGKPGKEVDKGWTCDLIPKPLVVARYFTQEQAAIDHLASDLESVTARLAELEEERAGDDGAFGDLEKINRANVADQFALPATPAVMGSYWYLYPVIRSRTYKLPLVDEIMRCASPALEGAVSMGSRTYV